MDLLKIIKRFRSDKDPRLSEFEGKCLSTFSREDLLEVVNRIKLPIDDVLVLLDVEDTRENILKIVSFALEQPREGNNTNTNESDIVSVQEPPKKKSKICENKHSSVVSLFLFYFILAQRDLKIYVHLFDT